MTLPDGSHPICLGFCLLPRTHAAVDEVIVAAGDGVLDSPVSFVAVVNYRTRSVLQEWSWVFNWHVEPPPVMLTYSIYVDNSVWVPCGIGTKR